MFSRHQRILVFSLVLGLSFFSLAQTGRVSAGLPERPILYPQENPELDRPAEAIIQASSQPNLILLKAVIFDPVRDGQPEFPFFPNVLSAAKEVSHSTRYFILQLDGPATLERRCVLSKLGAEVIEYIPNNAFLVRLPVDTATQVMETPGVRWVGPWRPAYKISSELVLDQLFPGGSNQTEPVSLVVEFFPLTDTQDAISRLAATFLVEPVFNYEQELRQTVLFTLPAGRVGEFVQLAAACEEVKWVEARPEDHLMNDHSISICQSGQVYDFNTPSPDIAQAPLFAHGIMGQDQVVAVADSGIDRELCFFKNSATSSAANSQSVIPPGPLILDNAQRKILAYNILPGADDGDAGFYHGTHVAGSVTGDDYHTLPNPTTNPPQCGHDQGDGMAPLAKIIFEDGGNSQRLATLSFPYPFYNMWEQERSAGAQISANSWAGGIRNTYLLASYYVDFVTWLYEDFLVFFPIGNKESGLLPNSYAVAKNVVAVGATSNGSQGANDMGMTYEYFSVRGPAYDGRIKPDLSAPGTEIISAGGNASHACQTSSMTGTSSATPTAAGLAALARQYFVEGWWPSGIKNDPDTFLPSAALIKAVLINSCANMTGNGTGGDHDNYNTAKEDAPAMGQGWGRITLHNTLYFQGDSRRLMVYDIPNYQGVLTNEEREYPIQVGAGQPLKLTLVWTDVPSSPASVKALVNDLNLELIAPNGDVYRGNQWNTQTTNDTKESKANPTGTDTVNNVEGILVKTPTAGVWLVRVEGANVPGSAMVPTQGYGLVITGDVGGAANPTLNIVATNTDDSTGNNNGVIDPGETIRLFITLQNTGTGTAANVNAILSATAPEVTVTQPSAAYGDIVGGRSKDSSAPFVFNVSSNAHSSTTINFTLTIISATGSVQKPLQFKVKPNTAPVMSNLVLTEDSLYQQTNSRYINCGLHFNYTDPDIDIQRMSVYFRLNGQNVETLPLVFDNLNVILNKASSDSPLFLVNPSTEDPLVLAALATNKGETLQAYAYLQDSQGNWSAITESNPITFTLGQNPATPNDLNDNDSIYIAFSQGFTFPFYGKTYSGCYLNTDGNISFQAGYDWTDRSPTAFLSNMPRIAPLYADLARSPGDTNITVSSTTDSVTFAWNKIPQAALNKSTGEHTFSVTLHRDGTIDFLYGTCTVTESQADSNGVPWKAVVGITPGAMSDYPEDDLSALGINITMPIGAPIYQAFHDKDTFDLSTTTLHFIPPAFTPAQTLYFPRLSYVPGTFSDGYGFVNTSGGPAQLRFTAYNTDGAIVGTPQTLTWPRDTQHAELAAGIIGLTQATDAWVKVESDQEGMLGFFLTQFFHGGKLAGLDGAAVFTDTLTDGIFPRVRTTGGYSTELFIANPGVADAQVTFTGYNGMASLPGPTRPVKAGGFIKADVATLLGSSFDGYLRIQSTAGVVGNAIIRYGNASLSSVNVMPVSSASASLSAAHITLWPGVYSTEVNLINLGDASLIVTLKPFKSDGSSITQPFTVNIPAHQLVTLADAQLGLPAGQATEGWLQVDSPSGGILGCLTFGQPGNRAYETTLPLQGAPAENLFFAQVANGPFGVNFFTGISIVNPADTPTDVTIQVFGSDGRLYGQVHRSLRPHEKFVSLLKQIENIGAIPDQSSGYIHIQAPQGVFAFELFGDTDLDFLSAVPAQY